MRKSSDWFVLNLSGFLLIAVKNFVEMMLGFLKRKNSISKRSIISYIYNETVVTLCDTVSYLIHPKGDGNPSPYCNETNRCISDLDSNQFLNRDALYGNMIKYNGFLLYIYAFMKMVLSIAMIKMAASGLFAHATYLFLMLDFFSIQRIFIMKNSTAYIALSWIFLLGKIIYFGLHPFLILCTYLSKSKKYGINKYRKYVVLSVLSDLIASGVLGAIYTEYVDLIVDVLRSTNVYFGLCGFIFINFISGFLLYMEIANFIVGRRYLSSAKGVGFWQSLYFIFIFICMVVFVSSMTITALVMLRYPLRNSIEQIIPAFTKGFAG